MIRATASATMIQTGLQELLRDEPKFTRGARLGLVAHPASVGPDYRHAADLLAEKCGERLAALFGPQHGARGEKQDNMIESDDYRDPRTGRMVYSLYGSTRKPTPRMLEGLDVLLFDVQDVGTRVYTFISTMALAMQACAEAGVRFCVLDRPNPIGGDAVEGNILEPELSSFVGIYPIPMRHGMTCGELALLFNERFRIGVELEVVRMAGWQRGQGFEQTGLPWVLPSPNMPSVETAFAFPGTVLLEGTNLSEGRGTTRPLELFGAPYFSAPLVDELLRRVRVTGAVLRSCAWEPCFQKWAGSLCHGLQVHVTDRGRFQPLRAVIRLLRETRRLCGEAFEWKQPPYEYELERLPIDLINGTELVRRHVDEGLPFEAVEERFGQDEREWLELRRPYLLYDGGATPEAAL
jgi:uncharacterized protein YbbC (DUF1343 family)